MIERGIFTMTFKKLFSSAVAAALLLAYIPGLAYAEEYDLAAGSVEVSASDAGQFVSQVDAGYVNVQQTSPTVITQSNADTSSTYNGISISAAEGATAEVTISGVNIDKSDSKAYSTAAPGSSKPAISVSGEGEVILELDGDNSAISFSGNYAGVGNGTTSLTIQDEDDNGSLYAEGVVGIGDKYESANITINGGDITAVGNDGSGIGSGPYTTSSASNITINGGDITASATKNGCGIGGISASDITINGGTVTATGKDAYGGSSPGIGGSSSASNITITGGTVIASTNGQGGAGIGGGRSSNVSNISISGGNVTATGGEFAAGIGGGMKGSVDGITISGGTVNATSGTSGGAGIGAGSVLSGELINVKNIKISGGTITANGGEKSGTGICGNDVTITGGDVTANGCITGGIGISANDLIISGGDTKSNGKGAGAGIRADNMTISNGTVNAKGGNNGGAGIQFQRNGLGHFIISGGTVTATGGKLAAGIGAQSYYDAGDITISGGRVTAIGGAGAAGIGGGAVYSRYDPSYEKENGIKSISVSGNARVKVVKGAPLNDPTYNYGKYTPGIGAGAFIGGGGRIPEPKDGREAEVDISRLTKFGYIEYWTPEAYSHTVVGTYIPPELPKPAVFPARLLRVLSFGGEEYSFTQELSGGILTVRTAHERAVLTGVLGNLDVLASYGVEEICFVTDEAQSAFELASLRAAGAASDVFRLAHDGAASTLTLAGAPLDGVLAA